MKFLERLFNGKPQQQQGVQKQLDPWDLDRPLFYLSPDDPWTIRDACEGVQVFGGIGSGKSSGSGATIAKSMLRVGAGMLVLCAPPGEREAWQEMAAATGRSDDVIVFSPENPWRLNFLDYELRRGGRGGGQVENLVNLFTVVMEIVEGKAGSNSGDDFFVRASKELLRNSISLLAMAQGTLTVKDIRRLIGEAPTSKKEMAEKGEGSWRSRSYCFHCLAKARAKEKNAREQHDYEMVEAYWLQHYPNLPERTRGSIVATFTGVADLLLHGDSYQLLGTETNIIPEVTFRDGAIILIDLPIQEYGEVGRIVQGIWKYMFQRALLRRNAKEFPRPVVLFCDESQNFVSSFDFRYQAECRKAKAATIYLTQNIDNYYAVLGGRTETDALLGNFVTKIFHANSGNTNQWASELISTERTMTGSINASLGDEFGGSAGMSESVQSKVLPSEFMTLSKGGPINNLIVQGYVVQSGRVFKATGETYIKVNFKQG